MKQRFLFAGAILLGLSLAASAATVTYDVTVNTSSIAGTAGSMDFNFNPGPSSSQSATVQIENFTSDGVWNAVPSVTGNVTGGPLPATLTFTNSSVLNDYFDAFTFRKTVAFNVSLSGPALTAPDGVSTSGSSFAFSMFSNALATTPALTSDTLTGLAVRVDVNLDGTTTVTNQSAETTVVPAAATAVPEPSSWTGMALAAGLAMLVLPLRAASLKGFVQKLS